MRFNLSQMIRRTRNPRRRTIDLREIAPPASMAGELYRTVYKPVIAAWGEAADRIAGTYARALPVADGFRDSIFDLDAILAQVDEALNRVLLTLQPALRAWAERAERWHRGRWRGAILTATGIDAETLLSASDVTDTVGSFVSRNVGLVRSVSDQTRQRIGDIVLRGYQARTPVAAIAKDMREAVGLSRARALRIAADQNVKLAARLDQARQEEAGIVQFRWRHSRKKHPRAVHVAHDGKVYDWANPPVLDGRPDTPGQLPFCGCRASAVISLD